MVGITLTIMEYRRARKSRESWLYGRKKLTGSLFVTVSRVIVKSYPVKRKECLVQGSRLVQIEVELVALCSDEWPGLLRTSPQITPKQ